MGFSAAFYALVVMLGISEAPAAPLGDCAQTNVLDVTIPDMEMLAATSAPFDVPIGEMA